MKKIIILELLRGTGLGDSTLRAVFWFAIPAARRVPLTGATSAYRNASAAELLSLTTGEVLEEIIEVQLPPGTSTAAARGVLEVRYFRRETEIGNLPNVNQFYGSYWNGTTWTVA